MLKYWDALTWSTVGLLRKLMFAARIFHFYSQSRACEDLIYPSPLCIGASPGWGPLWAARALQTQTWVHLFTSQLLFFCLFSFISPSTWDFLNGCAFSNLQKCKHLHIHFEIDYNQITHLYRMVVGIFSYEMRGFFSCFLLSFLFLML